MKARPSIDKLRRRNLASTAVFSQTIKTREPYEAPSLEAFLIGSLDPCENINLRNVIDTARLSSKVASTDRWGQLAEHFDREVDMKDGPSLNVEAELTELGPAS